ncbi:MAG: cyclic nucleotide-binding domain-containing protein [Proteobacteria bacterium]|nr:cyclic nucleotide-binding domain-containing protein [Pseudomonadota bacterium]
MAADPALLTEFEALKAFSRIDLMELARNLRTDNFRSGSQLCREGDEGDGCYFLADGDVAVTKGLPDGRRVHLATLPPCTLFGQSGLVPGQVRTADVKAETNVVVLTMTRRTLEWGLRQGEGWAVALQAIVAVSLVRQLRSALSRLSELAADEDAAEAAVEGRRRDTIVKPVSVDVAFKKKAKAAPAPAAPPPAAGEEKDSSFDALPPVPEHSADDEAAMSQKGLLSLLAETESSLANLGFDLEGVDFVYDEDQKRQADARGQGR